MSNTLTASISALIPARRSERTTTGGEVQPLVVRLQTGDDSALEPFIQITRDRAYRLAWSLLQDRHLCEDVLQDVYLTVYQKIGQLRDPDAFHTWFCRIVVNRCKRVLRIRRSDSLEQLDPELPGAQEVGREVPERLQVQQALGTLERPDREVLTLREGLQLSYEEIARALRVPLSTVRSRLAKARRRLLEAFTKGDRP